MVLLLADGRSIASVARDLGQQRRIVRKWADRFVKKRLRGLEDGSGRGRPALFPPCGCAAPDQAGVRAS
jgi:transposase